MALLGNLTGSAQVFIDPVFYNGVATQSLRFDDGSSTYLNRTFSGNVDNDKKMTISVWVKRGTISNATQVIIGNYDATRFLGELSWRSDDKIVFRPGGLGDGSSNSYSVQTTAKFRDVSAWYHLVLAYDSTQGTDTNRVKLYVNGTQKTLEALSGSHSFPPQNYAHDFSYAGANNAIGYYPGGFNSNYVDGYLSEFNFIDGLTLDPTYFGETKNGVWIAKEYTGSYGTNGYRLEFKNTSVGSGSSSTIGADTSGNDNHWTSNNIVASDCSMPDSPENNFATWNNLTQGSSTLSDGNLKSATFWTSDLSGYASTFMVESGKWYWEVRIDGASTYPYIGITSQEQMGYGNDYSANGGAFYNIAWRPDGTSVSSGSSLGTITKENISTFTDDDIISFALDIDARKLWVAKNNTWQDSGDPSAGTGENASWTKDVGISPILMGYQSQGVGTVANFGQDDTFGGGISSTGNTDKNGIGVFKYAPPTGFISLCTSNLAESTIGPNSDTQADDYFSTVLYTGNATDDTAIAVDFQPDWTWIKKRSGAQEHVLFDSSRGATKRLFSNLTNAESNEATSLKAFTSSGFTLGTHSSVNDNTETFVAWNWKANGGTTSSNTDGSQTTTVQANTTAGFSIVLYTGTGSTDTFGHGLGAVPKWFFTKTRSNTGDWIVYHAGNTSAPETDFLKLNETNATEDLNTMYNDTAPTSTVFTLSTNGDVNTSGRTQIAYCFAEVEGYSKFGSYTGNGNTDGTFVYLGFRPAWVLIKNTSTTDDNWYLADDTRDADGNPMTEILNPNNNVAEYTTGSNKIDFNSNGFKMRDSASGDTNISGEVYIYMAFARTPFKYANAK